MKMKKIALFGFTAVLAVLALVTCHNATYIGGFGEGVGIDDPTIPKPGEQPFLSSLKIVKQSNANNELTLSPVFKSDENNYVATGSIAGGDVYRVEAESKFSIVYTTGQTFLPGSVTFVIVTAVNGALKNDYVVSFYDPKAPTAKLKKIDFSAGSLVPVPSASILEPGDYNAEYPVGVESIIAAAEPELVAARIVYSAMPLDIKEKSELVIQVAAPGYNVGLYKIKLKLAPPQESFLDDVEFSTGSIAPVFDRNNTAYTLTLHQGESLTALGHVKKGSVSYSEGNALSLNARYLPMPKNNSQLKITANYGEGYDPKEYIFTIAIDAQQTPYTRLKSLRVDNSVSGTWTLWRREGGSQSGKDFDPAVLNYELALKGGALPDTLRIDGVKERGTQTIVYNPSETVAPPDPNTPWIITVSEAGYLPVTYHVFINYEDAHKPHAYLRELTLTGGVLDPFFAEYTTAYTAKIITGSNAILRGTPQESFFNVSYTKSNAVINLQQKTEITIKVDGGVAYQSTTYTITLEAVRPQDPYLFEITADDQTASVTLDNFYYKFDIAWERADDNVDVSWVARVPPDIKTSEWTMPNGTWSEDACIVAVPAGTNKLVQIRLTCFDGNRALYNVLLSREGPLDLELYLSDILINDTHLETFQPDNRSYVLYIADANLREVVGIPADQNNTVSYSLDSLDWQDDPYSISLQPGEAKTVILRVKDPNKGAHNDYFVTLSRATTLFQVKKVDVNDTDYGTVTIESSKAVAPEPGIMAGLLVTITMTPKDEGYIVACPPTVTRLTDNTTIQVQNIRPTKYEVVTYHFLMPDSHVEIKAQFESLKQLSNELLKLEADDGQSGPGKLAIMVPFEPKNTQTDIVTIKNSVEIKLTAPVGTEIREGSKEGTVWVQADWKPYKDLSTTQPTTILVWVVPSNTTKEPKPYVIMIYKLPNNGVWTFNGDGDSSRTFTTAPTAGDYYFSLEGAKGGGSKSSNSSGAGGTGGTLTATIKNIPAHTNLTISAGRSGGTPAKSSEKKGKGGWGWPGNFHGEDGSDGSFSRTAGGGGGGGSSVTHGNVILMGVGGGGSGRTSVDEKGGSGGAGGKGVYNGNAEDLIDGGDYFYHGPNDVEAGNSWSVGLPGAGGGYQRGRTGQGGGSCVRVKNYPFVVEQGWGGSSGTRGKINKDANFDEGQGKIEITWKGVSQPKPATP